MSYGSSSNSLPHIPLFIHHSYPKVPLSRNIPPKGLLKWNARKINWADNWVCLHMKPYQHLPWHVHFLRAQSLLGLEHDPSPMSLLKKPLINLLRMLILLFWLMRETWFLSLWGGLAVWGLQARDQSEGKTVPFAITGNLHNLLHPNWPSTGCATGSGYTEAQHALWALNLLEKKLDYSNEVLTQYLLWFLSLVSQRTTISLTFSFLHSSLGHSLYCAQLTHYVQILPGEHLENLMLVK